MGRIDAQTPSSAPARLSPGPLEPNPLYPHWNSAHRDEVVFTFFWRFVGLASWACAPTLSASRTSGRWDG